MSHAFDRNRGPARRLAAALALVWLLAAPARGILAAEIPAIEVDRGAEPPSSVAFAPGDYFAQVALNTIGYFNGSGVLQGTFPTISSGVISDLIYSDNNAPTPLVVTRSSGLQFYDASGTFIGSQAVPGARNSAYHDNVIYTIASDGEIFTFPPQSSKIIPGVSTPVWFDIDGLNPCLIFYTTDGQRVRRYNLCTEQVLPDLGTMPTGPVRNVRSLWDTGSIAVLTSSVLYIVDHGGRVLNSITTSGLGETGSFSGLYGSPWNLSFFLASATSGNVYRLTQTGFVQRILSSGFTGLSAATAYHVDQPSRIPIFDHSNCGALHQLTVGQPFEAVIPASTDTGPFYFSASALPHGAHLVPRLPLPLSGRTASVKFRWTPTASDTGIYRVTFSIGDTMGHSIATCAHDFQVSLPPGATAAASSASESGEELVAEGDRAPVPFAEPVDARRFELSPAWPSPASGPVHVRFRLDRARAVRLSIVDLQGRERAVLYQGMQTPGDHELLWDGRLTGEPAAPGVYFLRCRSGDVELTRKIVIGR